MDEIKKLEEERDSKTEYFFNAVSKIGTLELENYIMRCRIREVIIY